ncbi:MAG: hypothetical protein GX806_00430 [Lentisphaerae bacterium]|nr:hypothetical protein [Lentisphaerota bacterium]
MRLLEYLCRRTLAGALLLTTLALAPAAGKSMEMPVPGVMPNFWWSAPETGLGLLGRVEVGTRLTLFRLREQRRHWPDSFYGTITELREEQNYWPLKPFVRFNCHRYWGLEASWDQMRVKTLCSPADGQSDGCIDLHGPIFSVGGRYPLARCVPYIGLGLMLIHSSFDPTDSWHYRGGTAQDASVQDFTFDNTWAPVIYGGVGLQLSEHWSADLYLRYLEVDIKGEHYFTWHGQRLNDVRRLKFPLSNSAVGLSLRYAF